MTPAYLTPAVLRWARESVGYSLEHAAALIGVSADKLRLAETGESRLTLRQAERVATKYGRPFAALFLAEPPAEERQEQQFRRLPATPPPPWPPEMQLLARRVLGRQDAAVELYEALGEQPPWSETRDALAGSATGAAELVRDLLGITIQQQTGWRDLNGYTPLRKWTDAVEALGVLVLQDGTLSLDVMRGFAAMHAQVPVIVVNTRDDPRARAFTIIHEFGHLYLNAVGRPVGPETERWCDGFAGEVLMPESQFRATLDEERDQPVLSAVDRVALAFGVTPLAAATRAALLEALPARLANGVIDQIRRRGGGHSGSGGNYYRTQVGHISPAFARLVFEALDSQAVTSPAASTLFGGVKVSNFGKLRYYLNQRAVEA
jgi:Zn-dependent peptidase ImmA (M78 family)